MARREFRIAWIFCVVLYSFVYYALELYGLQPIAKIQRKAKDEVD